jgi:hypothetical protein
MMCPASDSMIHTGHTQHPVISQGQETVVIVDDDLDYR